MRATSAFRDDSSALSEARGPWTLTNTTFRGVSPSRRLLSGCANKQEEDSLHLARAAVRAIEAPRLPTLGVYSALGVFYKLPGLLSRSVARGHVTGCRTSRMQPIGEPVTIRMQPIGEPVTIRRPLRGRAPKTKQPTLFQKEGGGSGGSRAWALTRHATTSHGAP